MAELLVKEKKFNSEISSQLIKEKEQNTSLYQILNKEDRIDKVINELENIQKSQGNNNNNNSVEKSNKIPAGIIAGGMVVIVVGLGMTMIWARRKKLKK